MDAALKDSILEFDRVSGDKVEEVDAVVVGTGCGGAVVAKELAAAGWKVLMLERGGLALAERGDFDQREDDMMGKIGGGRGLDTTSDGGTALVYGATVGGASVHYWADTYRTPRDRCEAWAHDHGVQHRSHDELLPYFERIERDLSVHPAPDHRLNRMNQLFEKACADIGIETERVPNARTHCIGSGYCMQGCAYDAKQSQLVTYIPEALRHGAVIFADCEMDRIVVENGRATGVVGHFLDRRTAKPSGKKLTVKARRAVVIAAGGFNTPALLLKSGIADPSGQLGKNLQMNPGMRTFGLFDEDIVLWRNIPAAVGTLQFRTARYDESGRYVDGGFQLYPDQIQPATLAACLPGWGDGHRDLMESLHRVGAVTSWIDEKHSGSLELDGEGRPIWHFGLVGEDERKFRHAISLHAQILLAAGAREVVIPDGVFRRKEGRWEVGTRIPRSVSGVAEIEKFVATADLRPGSILYAAPHPAGGARMGASPRTSVVNSDGEVWSTRGLYVADPSAFPTVVSVDPSETIMAWSYVTARRILEGSA
jgi:choline dehydrogenase-like flavoprotein